MLKKGFTLIELLIVITIIAVLAGSAVPYIQDYVEDARIAKARADLNELTNALIRYEMERGYYKNDNQEDLVGTYLQSTLVDPWGAAYTIDTSKSLIKSAGGGNADITRSFRPNLRLTKATWIDTNNNGKIDADDTVHLRFTRPPLASTIIDSTKAAANAMKIGTTNWATTLGDSTIAVDSDARLCVITLVGDALALSVGDEFIPANTITDAGTSPCATESVYLRPFP